jgi:hypothetical protein
MLLGDMIESSQVIGYAGPESEEGSPNYTLRIEKNGVFIDACEFLGLNHHSSLKQAVNEENRDQ